MRTRKGRSEGCKVRSREVERHESAEDTEAVKNRRRAKSELTTWGGQNSRKQVGRKRKRKSRCKKRNLQEGIGGHADRKRWMSESIGEYGDGTKAKAEGERKESRIVG